MKKISEMTYQELVEAKQIIESVLNNTEMSSTAKEYYEAQLGKFNLALLTVPKEEEASVPTTKEDEQDSPFRKGEQDKNCSTETKECDNMDCIRSNGIVVRSRKTWHHLNKGDLT